MTINRGLPNSSFILLLSDFFSFSFDLQTLNSSSYSLFYAYFCYQRSENVSWLSWPWDLDPTTSISSRSLHTIHSPSTPDSYLWYRDHVDSKEWHVWSVCPGSSLPAERESVDATRDLILEDEALQYITYVMRIWAPIIPSTRWSCSQPPSW